MYLFMFADLLYVHVSKELAEALEKLSDHKRFFENLLLGVNVADLSDIERVARGVLQVPKERIRNTTRAEFVSCALNGHDFIDESGELI